MMSMYWLTYGDTCIKRPLMSEYCCPVAAVTLVYNAWDRMPLGSLLGNWSWSSIFSVTGASAALVDCRLLCSWYMCPFYIRTYCRGCSHTLVESMLVNLMRYPRSINFVSVERIGLNKEAWWKAMQLETVVVGHTWLAWISVVNYGADMW